MIKNAGLLMIAFMMMFSSVCFASSYELIQDEYTVQAGDSLDSITVAYMSKNTYGAREFKEFKSGIVELNPFLMHRDVKEGDIIKINYWVNKE